MSIRVFDDNQGLDNCPFCGATTILKAKSVGFSKDSNTEPGEYLLAACELNFSPDGKIAGGCGITMSAWSIEDLRAKWNRRVLPNQILSVLNTARKWFAGVGRVDGIGEPHEPDLNERIMLRLIDTSLDSVRPV